MYVAGRCVNGEYDITGYWVSDGALSKWIALGKTDDNSNSYVSDITLLNGKIYVSGYIIISGVRVAGFWVSDGSKVSWQGLTDTRVKEHNETVNSIVLDDGKICAAGRSYNSAGGYFIAGYWKYDGSAYKWNGLTNPLEPAESVEVSSITMNDGDIYLAAAPYNGRKESQNVGYYKNGTWIPLTTNHDATEYPNSMTGTIVVK